MAIMWVLFFVMQALLQTALGKATGSGTNVGVFGGNQIGIEKAPYMAALFHDNLYMCGGSIIHEWYILTAAYCCISSVNNVHVGSSDIYFNGTSIKVAESVIHKNYDPVTFNNNICLLKLQDRVPMTCNVAKLDLEEFDISDGTLVKITGWGLPERNGRYPSLLYQAEIPVVSEEKCRSIFSVKTESSFCAGSPGKDFCDGDVGGPLTYNNVQVGIASIGAPTPCGEEPALYTKISSFYSWIHENIDNNM